ncbi:MAG: hypothetical protein ONA90_10485 [candidate division KSB1 bacterium]|nr:hypothetical protein [candidate division KSB1 bacterium]
MKERGLDGIAVTNFHNVSFAHYLRQRIEDFLILVGQEIVSQHGHILAIGIEEKIPDYLTPEKTIRRIHDQGGLAILPHPYLGWNSILPHGQGKQLPFDAIETFNYRTGPLLWPNLFAALFARHHRLPEVSNTDSKELATIGLCYNEIPLEIGAHDGRYTEAVYRQIVPQIFRCIKQGQIKRCPKWQMPSWRWLASNVSRFSQPHRRYQCFQCNDKIVYKLIRRTYVCSICGQQETRHVCCVRGHYVCRNCRARLAYETEAFTAHRKKLEAG